MNDYKKISSSLKDIKTPDDIIAGIICQMKETEISASPLKIHRAFYELKQKHPDILRPFNFFKGNINHFSKLLERVLFRLEQASLLGTINPTFDYYNIRDDTKEKFKKMVLFRFSNEEKDELKTIAKELEKKLRAE